MIRTGQFCGGPPLPATSGWPRPLTTPAAWGFSQLMIGGRGCSGSWWRGWFGPNVAEHIGSSTIRGCRDHAVPLPSIPHWRRSSRPAGPAGAYWLDRLAAVRHADIEAVIARTPRLSDLAATFVLELLDVNRRRLLRDR